MSKDGIITGKHALNYEKSLHHKKNSFVDRNVKKGSVSADICCGTGVSIEFLKHKSKAVYGVDASEDMVDIARKRFSKDKEITIKLADAADTKLKSNFFDIVLIRMSLHHIKNKKPVIKEMYRVLKPKGKLIIIDKLSRYSNMVAFICDYVRHLSKGFFFSGHYYYSLKEFNSLISPEFWINTLDTYEKGPFIKINAVLEKL